MMSYFRVIEITFEARGDGISSASNVLVIEYVNDVIVDAR